MLACHTDRLSVRPGEGLALHARADHGPCRLKIVRVGAVRRAVFTQPGLEIAAHAVPAPAVRDGCGWPAAVSSAVGSADGPTAGTLFDVTRPNGGICVCVPLVFNEMEVTRLDPDGGVEPDMRVAVTTADVRANRGRVLERPWR